MWETQHLFHLAQPGQPRMLATLSGLFALLLAGGVFLWITDGPQPPRGFPSRGVDESPAVAEASGPVVSARTPAEAPASSQTSAGYESIESGGAALPPVATIPATAEIPPAEPPAAAVAPPPSAAEAPVSALPPDVAPPPAPQVRRSVTIASALRMREAPSISAPVLETLPAGIPLDVLEGSVVADGFRWVRIRTPSGRGGWAVDDGIE